MRLVRAERSHFLANPDAHALADPSPAVGAVNSKKERENKRSTKAVGKPAEKRKKLDLMGESEVSRERSCADDTRDAANKAGNKAANKAAPENGDRGACSARGDVLQKNSTPEPRASTLKNVEQEVDATKVADTTKVANSTKLAGARKVAETKKGAAGSSEEGAAAPIAALASEHIKMQSGPSTGNG